MATRNDRLAYTGELAGHTAGLIEEGSGRVLTLPVVHLTPVEVDGEDDADGECREHDGLVRVGEEVYYLHTDEYLSFAGALASHSGEFPTVLCRQCHGVDAGGNLVRTRTAGETLQGICARLPGTGEVTSLYSESVYVAFRAPRSGRGRAPVDPQATLDGSEDAATARTGGTTR
jgi:hypothetical protein